MSETVKTATLDGGEVDTFATESEHQGISETQGELFDRGPAERRVPREQVRFRIDAGSGTWRIDSPLGGTIGTFELEKGEE